MPVTYAKARAFARPGAPQFVSLGWRWGSVVYDFGEVGADCRVAALAGGTIAGVSKVDDAGAA